MSRPDWKTYFLDIADAVSARGECTRRHVAAVLVKNNRIKATGYNGAPAGKPSCLDGACPRGRASREEIPSYADGNHDYSTCIAIHAEANVIMESSREDREGSILYVTVAPCGECKKLIEGSGIPIVVWRTGFWDVHNNIWEETSKNL